jgi:ABC-type phosphate transport system substrate-binding protein
MSYSKAMQVALFLAAAIDVAMANAEVVVVVHPSNPANTMSAEQVADVFLGKPTELVPVDQQESSPVRDEFTQKVLGKDAAQVKTLWARLIFTGKATPPKKVASSAEVKKAVVADAKAIGYIEKSMLDATVKVVLTAP